MNEIASCRRNNCKIYTANYSPITFTSTRFARFPSNSP
jgi:hypothetical protein